MRPKYETEIGIDSSLASGDEVKFENKRLDETQGK